MKVIIPDGCDGLKKEAYLAKWMPKVFRLGGPSGGRPRFFDLFVNTAERRAKAHFHDGVITMPHPFAAEPAFGLGAAQRGDIQVGVANAQLVIKIAQSNEFGDMIINGVAAQKMLDRTLGEMRRLKRTGGDDKVKATNLFREPYTKDSLIAGVNSARFSDERILWPKDVVDPPNYINAIAGTRPCLT